VPQLLLIDDDLPLLTTMSRFFTGRGYEVVSCSTFESARRAILERTPDIVVTDVRLEAFNGLQLAMLARDVSPTARIIVFSGYADPVIEADARRIGATYLVKPVSGPQLLDEVVRTP
jgi:ActR/RegA family two-component response regulator